MAELTLKKREPEWLALHIGDKTYQIPLATSMTPKEAASVEKMDGAVSFFSAYMDEEVADALTFADWKVVIDAWTEASKKHLGDITPGES